MRLHKSLKINLYLKAGGLMALFLASSFFFSPRKAFSLALLPSVVSLPLDGSLVSRLVGAFSWFSSSPDRFLPLAVAWPLLDFLSSSAWAGDDDKNYVTMKIVTMRTLSKMTMTTKTWTTITGLRVMMKISRDSCTMQCCPFQKWGAGTWHSSEKACVVSLKVFWNSNMKYRIE